MADSLSTREAARIELARSAVRSEGALLRAFEHALRLSATALGVRRAVLGFANDDFTRLSPLLVYDRTTDQLGSAPELDLRSASVFVAALATRRTIVADDARSDTRTSELRDYLETNDIASMLATPVFRGGNLVGVVCHEHVGAPKPFTKHDSNFAASVADMIGLYLEQADLQRTYRELAEARSELEQARVMESLGRMAAGVAHDFNNILGAIMVKNDLVRLETEQSSVRAHTEDITLLLEQGTRLVRQLMTFARRDGSDAGVIDLGETIGAMISTLRSVVGSDVEIDIDRQSAPMPVRLERARLEQAVLNLVVNARDAMLGGGRIHISVRLNPDTRLAEFSVADTGVGMDEHTRARMFEPFFTTKSEGQGTGLGLATVYGIVTDAKGTIDVDSTLGEGTRITVRLPLTTT